MPELWTPARINRRPHYISHPFRRRKGRDVSYDAPVVKAHQFPQHFDMLWINGGVLFTFSLFLGRLWINNPMPVALYLHFQSQQFSTGLEIVKDSL